MSTLVNRNVTLGPRDASQGRRRTSLRLEPAMWEALEEICWREARSLHDLVTQVDRTRRESTLTAAIRVFALSYFRQAATELGHARAGHGRPRGRPPARRGVSSANPVRPDGADGAALPRQG